MPSSKKYTGKKMISNRKVSLNIAITMRAVGKLIVNPAPKQGDLITIPAKALKCIKT